MGVTLTREETQNLKLTKVGSPDLPFACFVAYDGYMLGYKFGCEPLSRLYEPLGGYKRGPFRVPCLYLLRGL